MLVITNLYVIYTQLRKFWSVSEGILDLVFNVVKWISKDNSFNFPPPSLAMKFST